MTKLLFPLVLLLMLYAYCFKLLLRACKWLIIHVSKLVWILLKWPCHLYHSRLTAEPGYNAKAAQLYEPAIYSKGRHVDETGLNFIGGHVYVLSNPSLEFGMVKIGMTTRNDVQIRVNELNSATSIPTPFVIEYAHSCINPYLLEQELHKVFNDRRVNNKREFFMVELDEIKRQIHKLER